MEKKNKSSMKKIAILYICTGKYNQFFKGFYESSEKYLLSEMYKHYFVFSDDVNLSSESNVTITYRKCQGFPADSLFRFEYFLEVEDKLKDFDYIYFFNGNSQFLQSVGEEILPDKTGLVGALWPWIYVGKGIHTKSPAFWPYEHNKKSLAYISPYEHKPYHYFMGGVNGGTSEEYLKMIKTLAQNIRTDYNNGIIAKVHDESHINRYFRDHDCKILGKEYCWPEDWTPDFAPKMIFRNKVKIDESFRKVIPPETLGQKLWNSVRRNARALMWYL